MRTLYTKVIEIGLHENDKHGVTFKPVSGQFITEPFFIEMSVEEVKKYKLHGSISFTIS